MIRSVNRRLDKIEKDLAELREELTRYRSDCRDQEYANAHNRTEIERLAKSIEEIVAALRDHTADDQANFTRITDEIRKLSTEHQSILMEIKTITDRNSDAITTAQGEIQELLSHIKSLTEAIQHQATQEEIRRAKEEAKEASKQRMLKFAKMAAIWIPLIGSGVVLVIKAVITGII